LNKASDMGEGEPWCSLLCLVTLLLKKKNLKHADRRAP
jgi:hypothetical protein